MLLPALNQARQRAYGARCQSNLKQMGIAFTSYCNDNKEYMFIHKYSYKSFGALPWQDYRRELMTDGYLAKGLKNQTLPKMMICGASGPIIIKLNDNPLFPSAWGTYLYNGYWVNGARNQTLSFAVSYKLSNIDLPSSLIVMADAKDNAKNFMSKATRLTPATSCVMRSVMCWRRAKGISATVAVIASRVLMARSTTR